MARRLFEEWTGNRGTEDTDEAEPEEEQLTEENAAEKHPVEHQFSVSGTSEQEDAPNVHQEPSEPPNETIAPGDSHGSQDEAPEPPVQATLAVTQKAEPSPKADDQNAESQKMEREKDNVQTSSPSITEPAPGDSRPQSSAEEPESNETEPPKETKPEADLEKPKEGGEQPKDKDTAED
ncbi:hypothetical protein BN14_04215 [Rhizoctonia solani AG-1 IB]|jgi:hypothetical protein|nr:hypothetical protein BN14_04215 [Rhizoctonia solani AG-1 IB]